MMVQALLSHKARVCITGPIMYPMTHIVASFIMLPTKLTSIIHGRLPLPPVSVTDQSICDSVVGLVSGRMYHTKLECRLAVVGSDGRAGILFNPLRQLPYCSRSPSTLMESSARCAPGRWCT